MNETIPTTTEKAQDGVQPRSPLASIRWSSALVWLGVFTLLGLLGWGLLNSSATRPEPGVQAPTFDMQYFEGYEWNNSPAANLQDMRGNIVVLNFWASWCVECRLEAELLENAWRQYGDQGVVFLGVAYVDAETKSLAYLQEFNITYPNAPDLGTAISDKYKITGVPETYFIDREGKVVDRVIGPLSADALHGRMAQLLAQ